MSTSQAPKIGIKQVKQMLQDGKTRKEIAEFYGQTQAAMNATVWQHPDLKGLKTKKVHNLVIVEDEDAVEAASNSQDTDLGQQIEEASTVANATEDETASTWNQPAIQE